MKITSYVCPKHSDIVLYKETLPETLVERVKKTSLYGIISFIMGLGVEGMTAPVPIFTISLETGPFECKKCKKHYFKWECKKNED